MLLNLVATMRLPPHMYLLYRSRPFSHFLHKSFQRMNARKGRDISLSIYCVPFLLAHGRLQQPQLIKDREKNVLQSKATMQQIQLLCERKDVLQLEGDSFVWCLRPDCTVIKAPAGFLTHPPETLLKKRGSTGTWLCLVPVLQHVSGEKLRRLQGSPSLNTHFCKSHQGKEECSEPEIQIFLELLKRKSIKNPNCATSVQYIQTHLFVLLLLSFRWVFPQKTNHSAKKKNVGPAAVLREGRRPDSALAEVQSNWTCLGCLFSLW